jgi:hypothetical protein
VSIQKEFEIDLEISDAQFALESEVIEKDYERQYGKIDLDEAWDSDISAVDKGKLTLKKGKRSELKERQIEIRDSPPAIQGLSLQSPISLKSDFIENPPRKPKFTKKKPPPPTSPPKRAPKAALPIIYRRVSKDLAGIAKDSLKTSFHTRRYSDVLRNQLIRAHTHSLLEFALKFEGYRKKNPYNKDPTWFLEQAAGDLFIFSDELQGVSNLNEADRRITHIDFDEIAQPASIGPFVGFQDPRQAIKHFADRISS